MRHLFITLALALGAGSPAARAADANWPDFRGPTRDGHAPAGANPPTKWSDADGATKWRTPIPGQGHSSPVVWGDRAWLTTALDGGRSLHAVCVDANTGKLVHDVEVFADVAQTAKHATNSFASPTPAVEDGRVYVYFGVPGLACLDAATGKPLWTNTEDFKLNYLTGAGTSPVLYRDLLILDCDGVDQQFVVGLDKRTGKPVWKTPRSKAFSPALPQKRRAFSTSVVASVDGADQLLSIGAGRTYGYDPLTGRELWHVDHGGYSNVARPLHADGLVLFSSGYDASELVAVKVAGATAAAGGKAKHLGEADVAWRTKQGVPYKPSFLLAGGLVYMVADSGVARALDLKTGKVVWTRRLGQAYSASPLYAGGHVYFLSEKGQVHVFKPGVNGGAEPAAVAEFQLDEGFMASPAVVGNALILRSAGHLYRVE